MNLAEVVALVLFIALCLGAGALGGVWTSQSVKTWYPTIRKPAWNPPAWVFAPVWTVLYLLMGIAAWIVWRNGRFGSVAGILFVLQLILNIAWSWFFFQRRRIDWALGEIFLLWVAILGTTAAFFQVDTVAGLMFLPYLAWVTFAAFLNRAVWQLNRAETGS